MGGDYAMKIKQEVIYRQVVGEHMLIPVGDVPMDQNGLFALTETGAFIWEQIEKGKDEAEILDAILNEFDVDTQTANSDLNGFLDRLSSYGIIER